MKRRWAWTLTITAALLAVVWVGSMKAGVFTQLWSKCTVSISSGTIVLAYTQTRFRDANAQFKVWPTWRVRWWGKFVRDPGKPISWLHIPLWPFILLTGGPGVWMLIKPHKYTNPNACPDCGYDKTGLPQSPTGPAPCPECGKSA